MRQAFANIIEAAGEDSQREGLRDTPQRAAKAFAHLTEGYQQSLNDIVNGAIFHADNDNMVILQDIEFYSLCEHHLLPFFGKCHIAYVPTGKLLGLSKMARIVDMFAKRLQIQERLTSEIATAIAEVTGSLDVAVLIEASHFCMMMRGVRKQHALMKTTAMLGVFKTSTSMRKEFFNLINP